jgi:ATP-dependent Clp protease protease subunit
MFDTMNLIKPDVSTICVGMAASMAAILLSSGAKGKRFSLPNAKIMIHQGSAGFSGTPSDIEITAREVLKSREAIDKILADNTGNSIDQVHKDTDRDYWMSAKEANKYGVIDSVITRQG